MLKAREIDALYSRYGFTKMSAKGQVHVYVLRQGYFHGADIVPLASDIDTAFIEKEYNNAGYASQVRRYSSIEEAEDSLFQGFFATLETKKRIKGDYDRFVNSQARSLGANYAYIPCPFDTPDLRSDPTIGILEYVQQTLSNPGPQLVLIEAAAGFGKTCTAYEILSQLLLSKEVANPIFTELSRNRRAQIFRYVLLDEIDRNYPSLSSDLVRSEVQTGRIPLIVDGFDELLSRDSSNTISMGDPDSGFAEAESMLDTIGELLHGQAKIVLTTRRTAIFSGDLFHDWMAARSHQFTLSRCTIGPPSIEDWLGPTRVMKLLGCGVPIRDISNPVLLAFLRNLPDTAFNECLSPEEIIARYIKSLLEREQERQALRLSMNEQADIFTRLAKDMIDLDISAESREFISEMILEKNSALIEHSTQLYPPAERPTREELANTLAGHALLDRIGRSDQSVGFVNDFVFGTFIGRALIKFTDGEWFGSERFFDLAVTAYKVRSTDTKSDLWEAIRYCVSAMDDSTQLQLAMILLKSEAKGFTAANFENLDFDGGTLGKSHKLNQCTFIQCVFRDVEFNLINLDNVGFLDCKFYHCSITGSLSEDCKPNWILGGMEASCSIMAALSATPSSEPEPEEPDYQKQILEQFWPKGKPSADRRRALRTLFYGFSPGEHRAVSRAISDLERRGLISTIGEVADLQIGMISEIRHILGRES